MLHSHSRRLAFIAPLVLAMIACNLGGSEPSDSRLETAVAGTIRARGTQTSAAASNSLTSTPIPAATATPSPTPSPTLSPTASVPTANLTQDTNCRTGPLRIYDLIVTVLSGQQVELVGKNADETYWYVRDGAGRECWLWGRYAQVSGDTSLIPVFTPPPSPTPQPTPTQAYVWAGDWSSRIDGDQGTLELSESGATVSGSFRALLFFYEISATRTEGGRLVSGEATFFGPPGPADRDLTFTWTMRDSLNQFTGSWQSGSVSGAWCGARSGTPMPDPCGGP